MGLRRHLFAITTLLIGCQTNAPTDKTLETKTDALVTEKLAESDQVKVIIRLRRPENLRTLEHEQRRTLVTEKTERFQQGHPGIQVRHALHTRPTIAATVTEQQLTELRNDPEVLSVRIDDEVRPNLLESVPALHGPVVHKELGFTGKGVVVAVLDSGVDKTIDDLKGAVVAEHCFTQGSCPPGNTAEGTSATDKAGHGTWVASIVASRGVDYGAGFAPAASIVAVRVEDDKGQGNNSDWAAGLDWVLDNLATQQVDIVNMSFGSSTLFSGNCDSIDSDFTDVVNELHDAGVTLFASSGNNGTSAQMQLPACLSKVISVGATYDGDVGRQPPSGTYKDNFPELSACFDASTSLDTVPCFSDATPGLKILAPGAPIIAETIGNGGFIGYGTSASSPTAAGIAALMKEAKPALAPDDIESMLVSTGVPVTDTRNNLTYPRVDALYAVRAAVCFGATDGDTCNDGDACSKTDTCQGGVCTGGDLADDGTGCSDDNACSTGDKCKAGVCTPSNKITCPPTSACEFVLGCDPNAGDCLASDPPNGTKCDDGNACTTNDVCKNEKCAGKAVVCPDPGECQMAATCDKTDGCKTTDAPDGTACSTGVCQSGACVADTSTSSSTGMGGDSSTSSTGGSTGSGTPVKTDSGCSCEVSGETSNDGALLMSALAAIVMVGRKKKKQS